MSIGSYVPGAATSSYGGYTAPTTSTGYTDPSTGATTGAYGGDSYDPTTGGTTSGPYGQDVPVQGTSSPISMFGMLAGAAGGGFGAFKLATIFAKTHTVPGLVIAGITGIGALIGGLLGKKFTGG